MEIEVKDYFQYNAAVTLTLFFVSFATLVLNFLTRVDVIRRNTMR